MTSNRWTTVADRTATAVREVMWDDTAEMFFDVDPTTMQRTGVKAAVLLLSLLHRHRDCRASGRPVRQSARPEHVLDAVSRASSSVDDPLFDPHAEWKGSATCVRGTGACGR
jgi:hypothetical protein